MKLSNKSVIIGIGNECPKCKEPMQRRSHPSHWKSAKSYFYTQWDFCEKCKHVHHYDDFKSMSWKEQESRDCFIKNI